MKWTGAAGVVAAAALLLGCGDPGDGARTGPDLPERDLFVTGGLAAHAGSRAALRAHLGEPHSVEREVVPNRHTPGVQDTLLTLAYPEVVAHVHRPGGGGELLSSVRVESNRHLAHPLIGESLTSVDAAFGAPDQASDSSLVYLCGSCQGGDNPVEILLRDGVVTAVRFNFYVD